MNLYQRIILVVGAVVFVVTLLTCPQVFVVQGSLLNGHPTGFAPIVDVYTASVRGIAVLGATAMLWFATKGIDNKKEG
jgi:hypothetical protein